MPPQPEPPRPIPPGAVNVTLLPIQAQEGVMVPDADAAGFVIGYRFRARRTWWGVLAVPPSICPPRR